MTRLGTIVALLKREGDNLNRAIAALTGGTRGIGAARGRRKLSAAAREKIAAAQRARCRLEPATAEL